MIDELERDHDLFARADEAVQIAVAPILPKLGIDPEHRAQSKTFKSACWWPLALKAGNSKFDWNFLAFSRCSRAEMYLPKYKGKPPRKPSSAVSKGFVGLSR